MVVVYGGPVAWPCGKGPPGVGAARLRGAGRPCHPGRIHRRGAGSPAVARSVAPPGACARTPEMTVAHFLIHAPATVHCAESIHRGKRPINGKPRAPISAEPITLDWPDH